jgi:ribosomal protein L13
LLTKPHPHGGRGVAVLNAREVVGGGLKKNIKEKNKHYIRYSYQHNKYPFFFVNI